MPLKLEIKKTLSARSERVKSVDIHPSEPWVLAGLYTGHLFLWNYQTETLVKSFKVTSNNIPVRACKFIPRKQWIVCASDDMQIRVYNYNTMEKLKTFEAHADYIRSLAVHPSSPYLLSSSDDMTIKLWDWSKDWAETAVYEGHTHYVMQVQFNPRDPNTFASASLDRTVKVWGLTSATPHFSLEGHERGVNCLAYFLGGERPYLLSGADDHTVRVWDYQTKACVAVLDGHSNNVSAVLFHPSLPIIVSGAEDGTLRVWHSTTYRLENTLNYGMERVWALACLGESGRVAVGYDEGTLMLQLGQEEPVVSMDKSGKVVWAKNNELLLASVKGKTAEDGERLALPSKELGNCEVYPQTLSHDPKGRLLGVCGDGEYIIYTALTLKNKSYGAALEFVWASEASGVYATRESASRVTLFKNFAQAHTFRPTFPAEGIFGGVLLAVKSSEFVDFYDWEGCRTIRRIEVCPTHIFWAESGQVVVVACETSFYVLRYNAAIVSKFLEQGVEVGEQGIDNAFTVEKEVSEQVKSGSFAGDCFIYTNAHGRLNYYIGGEVVTLAHLDKPSFVLGYLPKENRVYLADKASNVSAYTLLVSVLAYQTAVVRQDFAQAEQLLADVPTEHHNRLARFLESQGLGEMALKVSADPEHRFELAIALSRLELAYEIASGEEHSEHRWKQLGDVALNTNDLGLARECYTKAKDFGGMLLMATSSGNEREMAQLAEQARASGRLNIAFVCLLLLRRLDECVELLVSSKRIPEAALFARTYLPSRVPELVTLWKEQLAESRPKVSEALGDPVQNPELFPGFSTALELENELYGEERVELPSALEYLKLKGLSLKDLLSESSAGSLSGSYVPDQSGSMEVHLNEEEFAGEDSIEGTSLGRSMSREDDGERTVDDEDEEDPDFVPDNEEDEDEEVEEPIEEDEVADLSKPDEYDLDEEADPTFEPEEDQDVEEEEEEEDDEEEIPQEELEDLRKPDIVLPSFDDDLLDFDESETPLDVPTMDEIGNSLQDLEDSEFDDFDQF